MDKINEQLYHHITLEEVTSALHTNLESGLSAEEVAKPYEIY